MTTLRVLTCVLLAFVAYAQAQQCDQAFDDFHQCLKAGEPKRQDGPSGQRPNFDDLKAKADKCFTDNGCEAPKFPGGPGGPQGGPQGGPPGGRAGRIGGDDNNRKCFETVHNRTRDAMSECLKKADPTFTMPKAGGPHGGPGGPGGMHGGPGGPHGGPGGPGGPHGGGPGGPGGPGADKFLSTACNGNAANVQKVNACLAGVFPKPPQAPNQDQMRQQFDARCKAKSACEAKLGAQCKAVMEKRFQAVCTCSQQVDFQTLLKNEPACAGVKQPEGGGHMGGPGGPGGKQHDCNQKPKDPCEQGFDAFVKNAPHGGPGGH